MKIEKHLSLSDNEFEHQFATCQLDPTWFTHEAHLRLAWIHLEKYGLEHAEKNYQQQLENFVKHYGAADKYHKTITIMGVRAVHHFKSRSDTNNFQDFILECPALKTDFKKLINSHYSFDVFELEEARERFVMPN